MTNPFEFGRERPATEIVDRTDEVARVVDTIEKGGRLFLIGPRRLGKTSILRAAPDRAEAAGAVVLRYDAEAYPSLTALAERIIADAAKRLTGPVQNAGREVQEAFGMLRPSSPTTRSPTPSRTRSPPTPAAVVIDEFQRVVEDGGVVAEGQLRAAVQTHARVGYVFAGSKTRMLTAADPAAGWFGVRATGSAANATLDGATVDDVDYTGEFVNPASPFPPYAAPTVTNGATVSVKGVSRIQHSPRSCMPRPARSPRLRSPPTRIRRPVQLPSRSRWRMLPRPPSPSSTRLAAGWPRSTTAHSVKATTRLRSAARASRRAST